MGTLEVSEEPLPPDWEVAMSRSKNMPYYYNTQTKKVYWADADLPRGWAHQFDREGRRFYFHVRDKNATVSYDKPVLRAAASPSPPPPSNDVASPEPLPVPAPSYDSPRAPRSSDSPTGHARPDSGEPPRLAHKKSNSLMDLLSPGPPALGAEQSQDEASPRAPTSQPARTMHISNLVSSPERPQRSEDRGYGAKRSHDAMARDFGDDDGEKQREKDPDAAAAFYNQLQRSAQSDRADSLLFHMRALNNWVKSVLINEFSRREGDRVLDLACGKGGDLMKWTKRNLAMYVGVDIAQKSLEDAVERYTSFSRGGRGGGGGDRDRKKTEVQFIQGDLGVVDLLRDEMHCWSEHEGWHDAVPLPTSTIGNFNIVSVQFSFHYMFGDAQRANRFFSTVHKLLADGGVLIATTVDPNKLLMKYYQGLRPPEAEKEDPNKPDVSIVDEKKREVCCIRFDAATRAQLSGPDAASEGSFGLRYNFTLRDRVEEDAEGGGGQAVDLPEYLVPDDLLAKLLREHGFELLLKQNFHRFIQQRKDQDRNRTLLEKMHVTNIRGSISDAEWEIAGLYQVLAFKKSY
ncbi:hypothetical protein PF005_g7973 [Phytophthora fragariae]|uniref:mRNA (guanine-N(7))-methyltransferase n=1 Tax=Phytophthora fragariae TaxID=53985 RepID=A0A6A4E2H4_9STRA|nr:hypothetical protein PF003_g33296 [Phytophthora fragariae]KAE8941512.1 hypothetical protein PF009_g8718 [Phytophthora fragariae]KAE9016987.1 hypothetical protein PF011_g6907 [Phytophthora fragariae]KAE9120255.1 hypothetical protein PF007_g8244 [Phytophthora fragariae]KAE9121350.1 hypothetical protein PF010_g7129 [Phytophthora fragariae]